MNLPGYRVIEHLSRTRRLDTYEVWSEERACSCVVKALRPDRREDQRAAAALVHEGELLMRFTHPHIVRGYELIREPELAVVMETLDGETVAHLIERHPDGLEPEDVAWLGLHVTSALRYMHRHRLLHLDVKPSNLVADAGRAKLIDLSLARPPGELRPGIGTWCNLSPEQARGGMVGPPADVWGLGTVLYEAATGHAPFKDEESWTDEDTFTGDEDPAEASEPPRTWHTDDQLEAGYPQLGGPAPSAAANPRVPASLAAAIDACLAADPADRPTLDRLAEELQPCTVAS